MWSIITGKTDRVVSRHYVRIRRVQTLTMNVEVSEQRVFTDGFVLHQTTKVV